MNANSFFYFPPFVAQTVDTNSPLRILKIKKKKFRINGLNFSKKRDIYVARRYRKAGIIY